MCVATRQMQVKSHHMHGSLPDLPVLLLKGLDAELVRLQLALQNLVLEKTHKEKHSQLAIRSHIDGRRGGEPRFTMPCKAS